MRIRWIELENIKSYSEAKFNFPDGINFIYGINGAGKTTIIESIGFALFDYKISTRGFANYFIKKGEKNGTVRICFDDKYGDEYISYRKVSKSNASNIWSIRILKDGGEKVEVDGIDNVKEWIKNHLEFNLEDNITNIFEHIIGVPQGELTSAFLQSPENRKNIFNPIFNLDAYRKAAMNVRIDKDIANKINDLEKDNAYKNGKIESLNEKKATLKEVRKLIKEEKNKLDDFSSNLKEKQKHFKELDNLNKNIEKIQHEIQNNNIKLENLSENIINKTKEYESCKEASDIISTNKEKYDKYIQAIEEKSKEENNKKKFDILKDEIQNIEINIKDIEGKIKGKEEYLKKYKNIINNKDEEIKNKKAKFENEYGNIKQEQGNLEKKKNYANGIKKVFENNIDKKLNEYNNTLTRINTFKEDLKGYDEKLKQYEKIEEDLEKSTLMIIEKQKIDERINNINIEIQKIIVQMEETIKNESELAGGICPFLKEKCKNIQNRDVFLENKKELKYKEDKFKNELNELEKKLDKFTDIDKKCEDLKIKNKEKDNIIKQIKSRQDEVLKDENKLKSFSDYINNEIKNYIKIEENLMLNIENFKKYIKDSIEELNKEISDFNVKNSSCKKEAQQIKKEEEELLNFQYEYKIVEDELEKFRKGLENLYKDKNKKEINFKMLKDPQKILEKLNIIIKDTEQSYREYQMHIKEANKLDKVKEDLVNYKNEKNKINEHLKEQEEKINKLKQDYDEKEYESIKEDIEDLKSKISYITSSLSNLKDKKEELSFEIKQMEQLKEEIKEQEIEIKKLNESKSIVEKCKKILKVAPEAIAEVLIFNINNKASEIYTKLAADNCRLHWYPDYALCLKDFDENGVEIEKEFKELSGGERMSAALAIQLAMLETLTSLKIGFMDEPTVNMDTLRRERLAGVIEDICSEFNQIFVISHDDTFNGITENIINVSK